MSIEDIKNLAILLLALLEIVDFIRKRRSGSRSG